MTLKNIPLWALEIVADLPRLVNKSQAAELLHRSTRQLQRDIRVGRLRAIRTNPSGSGRVLIPRDELARFIASMEEIPQIGGEA